MQRRWLDLNWKRNSFTDDRSTREENLLSSSVVSPTGFSARTKSLFFRFVVGIVSLYYIYLITVRDFV